MQLIVAPLFQYNLDIHTQWPTPNAMAMTATLLPIRLVAHVHSSKRNSGVIITYLLFHICSMYLGHYTIISLWLFWVLNAFVSDKLTLMKRTLALFQVNGTAGSNGWKRMVECTSDIEHLTHLCCLRLPQFFYHWLHMNNILPWSVWLDCVCVCQLVSCPHIIVWTHNTPHTLYDLVWTHNSPHTIWPHYRCYSSAVLD